MRSYSLIEQRDKAERIWEPYHCSIVATEISIEDCRDVG